ncbi:MAG: peptidylprolyl isomerase [Gemmatimonadota bacterium]
MKKMWALTGALVLATAACAGETDTSDLVARVGDYELTVDDAVDLLVDQEALASDAAVVGSLAELWIDYVLLAEALAQDSTLGNVDVEPLVMQQLGQQMVFQLRDSVIQVDTFVTDAELRQRYEADDPEVEVRARHIMLQLPVQATQAQTDSVRGVLEAYRAQIVSGTSFTTLAQQFSQDRGSALTGGDLGYFARGQMVAPFEEAAFALEPGELSEVVATPMGLHLIRIDDRRVPAFDDVAANYRRVTQARMVQEAESTYVAALVDGASAEAVEGAYDIVRDVAENTNARLAGRAERRALIEWSGGEVSVGDVRETLQLGSPQLRAQVAAGTDEETEAFLQSLVRRDLLVDAAEREGLRPSGDSIGALETEARSQLRSAAQVIGLDELDQAPGEAVEIAVARAAEEALVDNLNGATTVLTLGIVSFQLRDGRGAAVFDEGIGQAIVDIAQMRAARALSPVEQTVDSAISAADTVGR